MNDKEFFELQLRATIVPQQPRWPAPEHAHWKGLHVRRSPETEECGKTHFDELLGRMGNE